MTDDKKKCYLCKNLSRYYTKGVKRFNKTDFGWCCQRGQSVDVQDCCDKFAFKTGRGKTFGLLKYYLDDLLTQISAIRYILEEETIENGKK